MVYDPSKDRSPKSNQQTPFQSRRAAVVVPSDTQDLDPYAKALYVGVTGDLVVIPVDNRDQDPVMLKAHPVGYVPVQVRRVLTSSTASQIVALFD